MSGRTLSIPAWSLPHVRLAALVAVGLAAFLVGWLVVGRDGEETKAAAAASVTSESELQEFAASAGHPVYWAGPRTGQSYEVTRTSNGRVFVRYLPEGVAAGDPRPNFLTIGTYPRANAFMELKRASRVKNAISEKLPNAGLAVYNPGSRSVYFGYPDERYQVEVYHPRPGVALALVLDGAVAPIRR